MDVLAWIAIGVAVGVYIGMRQRKQKEQPELPSNPPPDAKSIDSIYQFAEPFSAHFQSTVHPKEVLANAAFVTAAQTLAKSNRSDDELLEYLVADVPIITTLVLESLHIRGKAAIGEAIMARFNSFQSAWSRYFALRAIQALAPAEEPILGRIVVQADQSWTEDHLGRMSIEFMREFARGRVSSGEEPTFGVYLTGKSKEQLDQIQHTLELLNDDSVLPLHDELGKWRSSRLDKRWLESVGKVWFGSERPTFKALLLYEFLPTLSKMESSLTGARRRSVILVGESGVGKTALIHLAMERLLEKDWIVFQAGHNELLAGQTYLGQFEDRLQQLIDQLSRTRRMLWYVPDFAPLLHSGRHMNNPTGALDTLLPLIEKGIILIISEGQPGPFQRLLREKPYLSTAVDLLQIKALPEDLALRLGERWSERYKPVNAGQLIRRETLKEASQLAEHYLSFTAAPGNLLELLERARQGVAAGAMGPASRQMEVDDIVAALGSMSGIPRMILDERDHLDLAALESHFNRRVLGQPEAVECLVNRVALIKAGLTDPSRPLGVFLFAGPTGTGKTEIAKTLAEFLFGSSDRMVRLDMTEFKSPESLGRLVGEERSVGESLVDQVRKHPFSILLLDEFEKAHPNIWDCFLQVFDDGRLTDWQGRTVDFRNCLIIMTSNIGASIQTVGKAGFFSKSGEFLPSNVSAALEREFRKEFLNRIDRIVVFRPLPRDIMRGILRKELADAYSRRGLRMRPWAIEWDDSAIELLLEKGFTVDLGARPLKRAVERYVLTPLATTIVNRQAPSGDQFLFIRAENDLLVVDFVDPDASAGAAPAVAGSTLELTLQGLILGAKGKSAELMFLDAEYKIVAGMILDPEWGKKKTIALSMMSLPEFWNSAERFPILNQIEYRDRIEVAVDTAESLLRRAQSPAKDGQHVSRQLLSRLSQQLFLVRTAIVALERDEPWDAFVIIDRGIDIQTHSGSEFMLTLRDMYQAWAERRGMRMTDLSERPAGDRQLLAVSGFAAYTLLAQESGLHILEHPKESATSFDRVQVRVRVVPQPIEPLQPGSDLRTIALRVLQRLPAANPAVVRRYREMPSPLVRDSVRNWRTGRLDLVLDGNFDLITSDG